ncbi:hypothetical protein BU23DRAFT_144548 [Bimuria novae-zelandiae CBS 107.79]|uniref:Transmembrane protein n=1 Tax=Bimuria novae-zelandiae CBS 107.79 TaxID=1447943 RepID=A0A6A5V6M1_9PLEO|nr:hypothetical protein BU23DRAFT_144548 [Bimuria novae-zelandiae CBS 107.79]
MYRVDLLSIMKLGFCMWVIAFAPLVAADSPEYLHAGITLTASLKSVITPPPDFHAELFKRTLATCGYIRGNTASPLTCADGYNCVTTVRALSLFACCNNIECVQDWGICQEYGAQDSCGGLPQELCSSIYGPVLKCSSEAPHCYRYARSSMRGGYFTDYSYACGTATSDILVLATATNGNQDPTSHLPIPGYTYTPYASAPSSSSSTKSKLSIRSILLIVILGGGALFVALVLGFVFIHQRRKQNRNKKNSAYTTQPPPAYPPITTNRPVHQWNNGAPARLPPNAALFEPLEIVPTVHEVTAPVRPLHEMPGGYNMPAGGVGPLSDPSPPTYAKE